jgi:hypothetical protein
MWQALSGVLPGLDVAGPSIDAVDPQTALVRCGLGTELGAHRGPAGARRIRARLRMTACPSCMQFESQGGPAEERPSTFHLRGT